MISRRTMVCLSVGFLAFLVAALWWVYPEYVTRTLGLVLVDISSCPYIRIHPLFRVMVVTSLVMIPIAIVLGFVDRAHARKLTYKDRA